MTPTARLLAAVEAGSIAPSDLDAFIPALGRSTTTNYALYAYRGSVNAAIALVEAMLPGWWCELRISTRPRAVIGYLEPSHEGQADTPARALLIASLRALVDREAV